jgi:hypothetical protein
MQKLEAAGGAIFFVALGLASGCGDVEPEGASTAPGWSIPDDAVLGTLTDAQKETLCKETQKNLTDSGLAADGKELACRVDGVAAAFPQLAAGDAALQAACKPAYEACAAMPSMNNTCQAPTPTCTATMSEFRACLMEAGSVSEKGKMLLPSCDELTQLKLAALIAGGQALIPPTPACHTFEMKCPDIDIPIPEIPGGG